MYDSRLFEIVSESFFDKVSEHIVDLKKTHLENKNLKDYKFKIPSALQFFQGMTIE